MFSIDDVLEGKGSTEMICLFPREILSLTCRNHDIINLLFVAVSSDGSAKLWDCGSGSCIADLHSSQSPINACGLSTSAMMAEKNTTEPPGMQ